ncbi:hypothetical protein ACE1MK_03810 [Tenacibaculum maritimum]|uniref:hypothetical protein n=1 Tax=Tenacibaculum maritimum TaxID=107401 RepID=UPI00133076EE|nr:hypothetical protein [Tenacibaculum maritimum]MCD9582442.1 hypothetical protein [Tenacibaculum maritimum]MCD9635603.1 hypothetical protein [Tenacibaculum maritimum]
MKKIQLKAMASDLFITIYAIVTLFLRVVLDNSGATSPIESIIMGVCFVVIIWALIKLKILNPNWFGLF